MGYKFGRRQQALLQHIRCPECGVPMVERTGKQGVFYGCARFPICIGSRPQGAGLDSYTKLLHVAYLKAARCLSSSRFMGHADTPAWLLAKAFDREPTEEELINSQVTSMAVEHLERAIDAACEWASEKQGETLDFLVFAHDERYESLKGRLKYLTSAEQIRAMPKPEIVRRYDTSDITQFEADLAQTWEGEGVSCPRCGNWSSQQRNDGVVQVGDSDWEKLSKLKISDKDLASLFETATKEQMVVKRKWECGRCGVFTRTETKKGREASVHFEYEDDKKEPGVVAGASFKIKGGK